mmetsp:Transcript_51669/g.82088  ORF Transcript_51669/g.82088 Transcript_51669/m.82088 type:complete len:194 (-) Transcript_51669:199-780(-)
MGLGDLSKRDKERLKQEARALEEARRKEDESWIENDKKTLAKERRKAEQDAKHDAALTAKKEKKELEEQEEATLNRQKAKGKSSSKVTQAEIARLTALKAAAQSTKKTIVPKTVDMPALQENRNREVAVVDGTGLDAALMALECATNRATNFKEFEERMIAELAREKPGMKMSQIKEHVMKKWARSSENPRNS